MDEQLQALVVQALAQDEGSQDALWRIYELKSRDVMYTATKLLGNEQDAADATQEVFLKVFRSIDTLRSPKAFNAWLYRIVVNTCNSMLSKLISDKERVHSGMDMEAFQNGYKGFDPAEATQKKYDQELLLKAIDALPADQRSSVVLHYYDEMSYAEIASATGISIAGVEVRLRRARKALKTYLKSMGGEVGVPSLVAAPILLSAMSAEAQSIITPHIQEAVRSGISSALATVVGGAAAGTAAGVGSAVGSTTATGSIAAGSTSVAATAGGVSTKVVIAVTAATLATGGAVGAVVANNRTEDPPPPQTEVSTAPATNPREEIAKAIAALPSTEETSVVTTKKSEPAAKENKDPEPTKTKPKPKKKATAVKTKAIKTLGDMIGESNAQKLISYSSSAPSPSQTRSFMAKIGLRGKYQQDDNGTVYKLFALDKQDKRLYVIEKEWEGGYGISYTFCSTSTALPKSWELMFEY